MMEYSPQQAYLYACRLDVAAFKPGNVSEQSEGHGMRAMDFYRSAEASAVELMRHDLPLGRRIHAAVQATQNVVSCNTNLGIILLCAPLAQAALRDASPATLRATLAEVLEETTEEDSRWVYEAIRLASPGGLGDSKQHDVNKEPQAGLLEVMRYARERDLIAAQYADNFADLFGVARPYWVQALSRWRHIETAVTDLYLFLLSRFPDTHICRKHGSACAGEIMRTVQAAHARWLRQASDEEGRRVLDRLDRHWKEQGINPGTTADMTVACLFLDRLLMQPNRTAGGSRTCRR